MTTSKPQKLLLRFIVLLAICASISLWPAIPKRGAISKQLGLIVSVGAQAPVTLDRSIRDYKLPSEIPWVERGGSAKSHALRRRVKTGRNLCLAPETPI